MPGSIQTSLASDNVLSTALLWHVGYAASFIMFIGWLWQVRTKNAGIVDALWALGTAGGSVYLAIRGRGDFQLRLLLGIIGGLWFSRLSIHLLLRVLSETHEDGRYRAIRDYFGHKTNLFHSFFYLIQVGFVVMCVLPYWVLSSRTEPQSWAMVLAAIIVTIAFIGESQADRQLLLFRQDPDNKGKTCRHGLWKYSRHPNYFFEWCHCFAYPILGIGLAGGLWLWLAPVVMFLFLYYGTGIPYTELQAVKSRGDDYRHYQRTTSAFFPMPPKQNQVIINTSLKRSSASKHD